MSTSQIFQMRGEELEQGLLDMIAYINRRSPTKNMRLLEIGAYTGESTAIFCQHFKHVTTIDPYKGSYDPQDYVCYFSPMSTVYEAFCARMSKYNNYKLIIKTSDEAIKEIADQPVVHCFDVVYIDGMHQYAQVKKDILNYRVVVNRGGFVTGHDYGGNWVGYVDKAVNDIYGEPDVVFNDTSWLVRKGT